MLVTHSADIVCMWIRWTTGSQTTHKTFFFQKSKINVRLLNFLFIYFNRKVFLVLTTPNVQFDLFFIAHINPIMQTCLALCWLSHNVATRSLISSKYVFVTLAALSSHLTHFFLAFVEAGAHYCLFVKKKKEKATRVRVLKKKEKKNTLAGWKKIRIMRVPDIREIVMKQSSINGNTAVVEVFMLKYLRRRLPRIPRWCQISAGGALQTREFFAIIHFHIDRPASWKSA